MAREQFYIGMRRNAIDIIGGAWVPCTVQQDRNPWKDVVVRLPHGATGYLADSMTNGPSVGDIVEAKPSTMEHYLNFVVIHDWCVPTKTEEPSIDRVATDETKETYLPPGDGFEGTVGAGVNMESGDILVGSRSRSVLLEGSAGQGYSKGDTFRYRLKGTTTQGGRIPTTDEYCRIDPNTGLPTHAQDDSIYEATVRHLGLLVFAIPTSLSRGVAGRVQLIRDPKDPAKYQEYQEGQRVGFTRKQGFPDMSDNHWPIDTPRDDSPEQNDLDIVFALEDRVTETMLVLRKPQNDGGHSVEDRPEIIINGTRFDTVLVKGRQNIISYLDKHNYPRREVAKDDYRKVEGDVGDPWVGLKQSYLDIVNMTLEAAKVGNGVRKLTGIIASEADRLGIRL
jgi:hypothetical protein